MKKTILVLCKDNLFLSKVAEAFLKKFGNHWKNIISGGLNTENKTVPSSTIELLKHNHINSFVDTKARNVTEHAPDSFEIVLFIGDNKSDLDFCKKLFPQKEIFQIEVASTTSSETIEKIENECLNFIKQGPIKRWLKNQD